MTKEEIINLAVDHGWVLVDDQEVPVLIFQRGTAKLNVYWSKMTIATTIDHPKGGRKQLFRKGITREEFLQVLINPRIHTNKGYFSKYELTIASTKKGKKHDYNRRHSGTCTQEPPDSGASQSENGTTRISIHQIGDNAD